MTAQTTPINYAAAILDGMFAALEAHFAANSIWLAMAGWLQSFADKALAACQVQVDALTPDTVTAVIDAFFNYVAMLCAGIPMVRIFAVNPLRVAVDALVPEILALVQTAVQPPAPAPPKP